MNIFLLTLFIVGSLLLLLVRALENTSVYYPSKEILGNPSQIGLIYEDLYIKTSDGISINAWFIPNKLNQATLIFAHGNAGNIGDRLAKIKFWHDLGVNVMIFDYRGYGKSQGKPSERGIYQDAMAVYDFLVKEKGLKADQIIAYGASLGGAVVTELALRRKVAVLIIEASFTKASALARVHYPYIPTVLMSVKLDTISKIDKISSPKLFMHSKEDTTVPYKMGEELYHKSKEPKSFIEIFGGHNEGVITRDLGVKMKIQEFLKGNGLI